MSHEHFNEVVARILSLIPETEALYETSILEADDAENLLAEARELLAVRNLHALAGSHQPAGHHQCAADAHRRSRRFEPPRRAHRRAESPVAGSHAGSRVHAGRGVRPRLERRARRSRSLQADQRKVRHPGRRQGAAELRAGDSVRAFAAATWWRASAAKNSSSCCRAPIARSRKQVAQRILAALAGADHGPTKAAFASRRPSASRPTRPSNASRARWPCWRPRITRSTPPSSAAAIESSVTTSCRQSRRSPVAAQLTRVDGLMIHQFDSPGIERLAEEPLPTRANRSGLSVA